MKKIMENYSWRNTVHALIQKAYDLKVIRGGLSSALDVLDEAQSLISGKKADTWQSDIFYRKAHICFRCAGLESMRNNKKNAVKYLEKAIDFFHKAEKSPCYSQLSKIYQIPAYLMLGKFDMGSDSHIEKIKEIYCDIKNDDEKDKVVQLDTNRRNLIELSAYYSCFWSNEIEGIVPIHNRKFENYTIFSPLRTFENIDMTKDFAFNEINDIVNSANYDIAFRVDDREVMYCDEKTDNKWKKCSSNNRIRTIFAMFNETGMSPGKWFEKNFNSRNFKKYKNDLKAWLSEEAEIDRKNVFSTHQERRETFSETFRLFVAAPRFPEYSNFLRKK
ncbi:MAG: hypothetical protein K5657_05850 [Desulfovibrio sp.]|nr:hypothetical protein [Desulfovibrio sp.]